jgi:CHAT domain-containing protein
MKKHSLIWKAGYAVAIATACMIAPSVQRSIAQYPTQTPSPTQEFPTFTPSKPQPIQPPLGITTPTQTGLCDRLLGSICNPTTPNPDSFTPVGTIDRRETDAVCSYTGGCPTTAEVTFESVQESLKQAEKVTDSPTALVYVNTFDDRLEILVIPSSGKEIRKTVILPPSGQEKSSVKQIDVKQNLVTATVQDLLDSIRDPTSNDYLRPSQKLYDWLIRPIEADLETAKIKTLIFVMDGPLRAIPISVLNDGKKFLVQKYATATVPSMGLVNLKLSDRRRSSILIMGLTEAQQGFAALPNVDVETNAIASQILQGKVFLNQNFTVDTLRDQQNKNNYGIVHIATHAQFLSDTINGAFIQFWNDRLYLDKLRTLSLGEEPIEMLTLSACETAVGQNLGLSGTAVVSRAKSVLASLWEISDAGTTPLMLAFYNNYSTSKSKAIAIQKAQLELLQGKVEIKSGQVQGVGNLPPIPLKQVTSDIDLKHPYFWASFILVGNWL